MRSELRATAAASVLAACLSGPALADVVISSDATQNMSCANNICSPTATDAVLNAGDLQNLLASGNVEVTTTGSAGVQASNIDIVDAVAWSNASTLSLDAYASITLTSSVTVAGSGGMSLTTNDGGSGGLLLFLQRANIAFSTPKNSLVINGANYKLETSIRRLAFDIAAHPDRAFALARDIDEKHRVFRAPPISANFAGFFNGLGHTISNFAIADESDNSVAFFATMSSSASIASIGLENIHVTSENAQMVGGLIAQGSGIITNSWVTGSVKGTGTIGALVSFLYDGTVSYSWASAHTAGYVAGGLVGSNSGTIDTSFATGPVIGAQGLWGGGLVGYSFGTITNSYAVGKVHGNGTLIAGLGGLVGGTYDGSIITSTYSAGHVGGGAPAGGFIGVNGTITAQSDYWDKSVNKTLSGVGGGSDAGIKGVSTRKLQSGLPKGFDPSIWAESTDINGGFPYLIANPPQ